jgi:secretion/DNA translocation related TadE-like protein
MSERGSALPFAVAALGMLLLVGAVLGVAEAMVARHRTAQSAADLGALAAAGALQRGTDPCGAAADVVTANGAHLTSCTVSGPDVVLAVEVAGPGWLGARADLTARARAGPRP